jgi:very-short-patch-repair endonuclease
MIIPFESSLRDSARTLRKNQTRAEIFFWNMVRGRKILGHRFLRQKPILSYIVDFYCAELKLAVEIDGSIHQLAERSDLIRTSDLQTLGIIIIRYTNDQVLFSPADVREDLKKQITSLASSLP